MIAASEAYTTKGGKRRLTAGELQMLACEFRKGVRKVPVVSPLR